MPDYPKVGVTGHRPESLTTAQMAWLRNGIPSILATLHDYHGAQVAISGMARGVDLLFARAAVSLGLDLHCYVPFPGQDRGWQADDVAERHALLAGGSVQTFGNRYDVRLLHARNQAIVSDTDLLVAVLIESATSNGTRSTVLKARRAHKPILLIDPERRVVTWPLEAEARA